MKKIICTFCLIILVCSCTKNKVRQKDLQIKVEVSEKIDLQLRSYVFKDCYPVKISLINNTDTTIRYWIMRCSWEENFVLTSDSVNLFGLGCDGNFPTVKEILPVDTIVYKNEYLRVFHWSIKQKTANVKLGFILIRENESTVNTFDSILSEKRKIKTDVIWSDDPIILKR
jgi:mitochondrial fission protein ELM1